MRVVREALTVLVLVVMVGSAVEVVSVVGSGLGLDVDEEVRVTVDVCRVVDPLVVDTRVVVIGGSFVLVGSGGGGGGSLIVVDWVASLVSCPSTNTADRQCSVKRTTMIQRKSRCIEPIMVVVSRW
jgi:hypothetical protein